MNWLLLGLLVLMITPAMAEDEDAAAFQAARDHLAKAGFTVPDEAFDLYCEASVSYLSKLREHEFSPIYQMLKARLNDPASLASELYSFAAHGRYDHDTGAWTAWSSDAYAFDAEIFDVGQMYTLFFQGVQRIVPDAVFTDVTEDLSGMTMEMDFNAVIPTDGTRSVSFLCNGHPYTTTLVSYGDWFNEDMFTFVNQVLAQEGCAGQLYPMSVEGQSVLLVYGSEQKARNLAAYLGYEPRW